VPEWRKRYYERVAELRKTTFLTDAMDRRIDELAAKVQPVLDEVDKNTARGFPNQVKGFEEPHSPAGGVDRQAVGGAGEAREVTVRLVG